ncbi:hypothetical protein OR16_31634 [Cupriavidus basilensis OR16]|uniref:Uncharacterized protein n=1 Tax=Cupriavidus basilensis OR16 TaxID=1127483 RepID=H1SDM1_9BURK|nr:hypothetical protein [Cupriavidus basilensis]EHP39406.1 hypothetical protein OR16_31634 [Cupriavidus basilensis OR16]
MVYQATDVASRQSMLHAAAYIVRTTRYDEARDHIAIAQRLLLEARRKPGAIAKEDHAGVSFAASSDDGDKYDFISEPAKRR